MQFLSCLESALTALGGKLEPSVKQRLQQQQLQEVQQLQQQLCTQHSSDSILSFSARRILPLSLVRKKKVNKTNYDQSSQDSSVGSTLDWYSEGPEFKSRRLQLNFQLEKGCRRDSKQYNLNQWRHYKSHFCQRQSFFPSRSHKRGSKARKPK